MKYIKNCFIGMAIGAGAILPGISSGVFCVIFGIYEKLLNSILGFFTNIKENIKFLLPICIGTGIGIIVFGNLLNYLFYAFPLQTKSIFVGLILGSIPYLIKNSIQNKKIKISHIFCFFLTLIIGILTVILEHTLTIQVTKNINFIYLTFCGFLMSIGVVVPGVSSTIILMLLGVYSTYLTSVSSLYLPFLIPMGIGLIIGGFIFMKCTKYLLEHFHLHTFFAIIGFTLGSIFVLLPTISSGIDLILFVLCTTLGFYLVSIFN